MSDVSAWLMRMGDLMYAFNMFGVAVFAVTGGLAAARKQMDILAFVMIGIVTGVGGGTMRDLALGISPVFWVADPNYIIASTIAAIATYFLAPLLESRFRALLWGDALGMALFTVSGTQIALGCRGVARHRNHHGRDHGRGRRPDPRSSVRGSPAHPAR